ncbi:exo-alpha-sialidase [Hydrotalea sp.]|uniref:WD40/YVTN/BNR-like repeat-containing protein n=1 Tax=Hydrotalea sp. TaxID=2881279 RepID=UPI002609179F|nr:exo-alpha-sialidase [Hydrotalea sp.]
MQRLKKITYIFVLLLAIIFLNNPTITAQQKNTSTTPEKPKYGLDLYNGMHWRNIGPWRAGRCLAVMGLPNEPHTYYAGQTGGGVWKTVDGANTWKCISDSFFTSSSVGAIAVAHTNQNIVYAGTGEVEMRNNISFGDGIYKSTDAGKTWKHIGLEKTYAIGTIAINPENDNQVYAAAMGKVYGANKERGLYRSNDGGNTWQKILYVNDSTGCVDVKIDPVNPLIIYASMWQAYRTPYSLSSGGKGCGLYQSMDGGNTWQLLSENPGMPNGLNGKIICTISPVQHERVWAIVENANSGVFRSDDGGATWQLVSTKNDLTQRPWYFSQIFADTKNANTVYALNVEFWKSIDGGVHWKKIANRHGDNHDMWINPNNPNNWIMGDDGGPQITYDGGKNFTIPNLPTAQFYHVNLDNEFPYHVYGAQQDNTSVRIASRTANEGIGIRDWYPVAGGEAGYIVPDPLNAQITYGGEYDGQLSTYNKSNDQNRNISVYPEQHSGEGAVVMTYRFNWTYPVAFSPFNPKRMYVTSNHVHRTTDGGQTWETISPDLTKNDPATLQPSGGPITLDNSLAEVYGTIFAFAESPVQKGVLWTGSDDGLVHISKDDGQTWQNVTPPTLPKWALISYIEPSHFNAATCYVSATRYQNDDTKPYLFKTHNYGKTWTAISEGVQTYNRCIRQDPAHANILYCGTETGILISFDEGEHWQSLQLNLPNTPVRDIQVQTRDNDLVIATHGRSFWILDDITPLYQLNDEMAKRTAFLFKPKNTYRTPAGNNDPTPPKLEGQNAPAGAIVHYYFKNKPAKEVRLAIQTEKGDSIITYSSQKNYFGEPITHDQHFIENPKKKQSGILQADSGMNTFIWDLRYPDAKADTSATFEGALTGPLTVPGNYTLALYLGDSLIQQQPMTIVNDPRNPFGTSDLMKQFELAQQIHHTLNTIGNTTKNIRQIRKKIQDFAATLSHSDSIHQFNALTKPLLDSLSTIETALMNPKILASEDDLRFPVRLEEKLSALNMAVQQADAPPTASMFSSYEHLKTQINRQLDHYKVLLQKNVPAINQWIADQKQPFINQINLK